MINTGAIVLCSLIKGDTYEEKFSRLLDLTRKVSGNANLEIDEQVYLSEKATGNKNRALAYMLKAYGMMEDDVEEVLDCYFSACSIKVTTVDLARIAYVFAHGGVDLKTGERLFEKEYARYVNAVLMTCGMYDGSAKKVNVKRLLEYDLKFSRIMKEQNLFDKVKVQPGGYGVCWDEHLTVPDYMLYDEGEELPLSLDDFRRFVTNRVVNTAEAMDILDCSRQNMNDLIKRGKIEPIKKEAKSTLFLKSDIEQRLWK